MPGIFNTRGTKLRIPVGGLRMTPGGPELRRVETRLEMWDRWLAIARKNTEEAEKAHARLRQAIDENDEARHEGALEDELRASAVAIAASAFAVDGVYAAVKEHTSRSPSSTRHREISETFNHCFEIKGAGQKDLRDFLEALFDLRDHAVHPHAEWQSPVLREDLGGAPDWQYTAFSASNARIAFDKTSKLFDQLFEMPKPKLTELVEWTTTAKALLAAAVEGEAGRSS